MLRVRFVLGIFLFALAAFARAQSVRWEPSGGSLALNQTSELQLIFEGCEPSGEVVVPEVPGLTLVRSTGEMRSTTIVNGRRSQSVTLVFAARPTAQRPVAIPSFKVGTDRGALTVAAANFDVGQATLGQSGVALDKIANARFTAPREVFAGEVFPLGYQLDIVRRYAHSLGGELEWKSDPLTIEEWSKPQQSEGLVNGDTQITLSQATRGVVRAPGAVTLNAGSQLLNVIKGTDFFGRANLDQFAIASDRPTIAVKPLPEGAPASFNGAVGRFTLESKVVPAAAAVGEPVTWTLTLSGAGNWPDLPGAPAREASKVFRVIQPQAKRTPKAGALFDATLTEDVVLIPTQPGAYTLGPVTWSYFDPAKGKYETITTPRATVTITAAPGSAGGTTAGEKNPAAPDALSSADGSSAGRTPFVTSRAPGAIPRDPLPGSAEALAPLPLRTLLAAALAPLAPLLAFWFRLALRSARETDPLRPQREARARLADTLAALRRADAAERVAALLQAWQRDTSLLWPLERAVPTAEDFAGSVSGPPAADTPWPILWAEAERTLYRADTPLPADWIVRAEAALAARPVKPFSALGVFRPRNLLPFAAALIVFFSPFNFHPSVFAADTSPGAAAYARADFAAAEKSWREKIAAQPTDWIAHHNLALALAQQNRWPEAAAHATTAFVQHPSDASVRWHLALTLERAGYAPSTISAFLNPSPLHSLARQLSPAVWQVLLIVSTTLAALAAAFWLLHRHRASASRARAWKLSALALASTAAALFIASVLSLRLYRPAHDPRVALVWKPATLRSIPTEADTAQKTTPLAAGTLAIVDKNFLENRWSRLVFANGQTGWVRSEDLKSLWR
jgi:tetratricopeptide (TPR) repeat protein